MLDTELSYKLNQLLMSLVKTFSFQILQRLNQEQVLFITPPASYDSVNRLQ